MRKYKWVFLALLFLLLIPVLVGCTSPAQEGSLAVFKQQGISELTQRLTKQCLSERLYPKNRSIGTVIYSRQGEHPLTFCPNWARATAKFHYRNMNGRR